MAHKLSDRELLGIIQGEIVWNPSTDRWEKKPAADYDIPWWRIGVAHTNHPSTPISLPKEPPPSHESLPTQESPEGLTHDQLVRIHQLNDLTAREVITDAARDAEVRRITSEPHQ